MGIVVTKRPQSHTASGLVLVVPNGLVSFAPTTRKRHSVEFSKKFIHISKLKSNTWALVIYLLELKLQL